MYYIMESTVDSNEERKNTIYIYIYNIAVLIYCILLLLYESSMLG